MKKLLFSAIDMNIGGIEKALLTLLNYLVDNGYDITLVLENKQGTFLKDLDSKIKVVEYKPSTCKITFIRRSINLLKRIKFILQYKNRFDFSASFATSSIMGSFVSRIASKNSALWIHADYLALYKGDKNKVKEFFQTIKYNEFKKIVFVSKKAKETFREIYPNVEKELIFCNNLIDYKKIKNLANEPINENKNRYTFVNISRHDELQKKITRIIEAAKLLKSDSINFKILLIGEGKDTIIYKRKVKEYNLSKEIEFLGAKKNPYPYIKNADTVLLTSDYEGYPVIFLEALILNKPIITTDISDAKDDIDGKFGKVIKKDVNSLYIAMKDFVKNGYEIKEKFSAEEYNKKVIENLKLIFEK